MSVRVRFQFWIDRGGTFTDCMRYDVGSGELRVAKVLSSDDAPLIGIRALLDLDASAPIPACEVRMGTTLGTNALLERRGTPTALWITRGFGDLLTIGDQTRPDLFDLDVRRPPRLAKLTLETDARRTADGDVLARVEAASTREQARTALAQGIQSAAVVVMHDQAHGDLEREIEAELRSAGFQHLSLAHEVSGEAGLLARAETTVVDAYLTPLLTDYLRGLEKALPDSRLLVMQSGGGLADSDRFRGRDSVLSGPAGGVIALGDLARRSGAEELIGFDMGGTSTDVSRYAGKPELTFESVVSGVHLRTPMMDIHTIAAGGGSLCRYVSGRLSVGPESAGAHPGPLCYGRPEASELALTDVNVFLGRVLPERFPFALSPERVRDALSALAARVHPGLAVDEAMVRVAQGFFDVAVESMAEAIRKVSVGRGHDVRRHALAVFGGAGGQHACAVARRLGMREVLLHPHAGVLSAFGMGIAERTQTGQRDLGGAELTSETLASAQGVLSQLAQQAGAVLASGERWGRGALRAQHAVDLRYRGTEAALTLPVSDASDVDGLTQQFQHAHERRFGYRRDARPLELVAARVRVSQAGGGPAPVLDPVSSGEPTAVAHTRSYLDGRWHDSVPVFERGSLPAGFGLAGPAIVVDQTSTLVLEPDCELRVEADGVLRIRVSAPVAIAADSRRADPVLLEVFNHLFMSVAEQMGAVLRRTAISTNIRERLDFSCAVFDPHGGLVANAPHIPVHLGAMGESVRAVLAAHPDLERGDVVITNDPAKGGSHLPDITVVSPVFDDGGGLRFVCANRGHHADVGGISPGSVPPHSTRLSEEGVVLSALRVVRRGQLDEALLRSALSQGEYPARQPSENLADLTAQIAANQTGIAALEALSGRFGEQVVRDYMGHIQTNAASAVREAIGRLPDGDCRFEDALDDGTRLCVRVRIQGETMEVDFQGTAPPHPANFNAPHAVTRAAVLYVVRTLLERPIPLNDGCLEPVRLRIPSPSLLDPPVGAAVVAGNVETSQRVVDILLGALGVAAASQGTMNNLTFGNDSFGYYETLAGGVGATPNGPGESGVHSHMTNTRITDPEVLERRYPVRLRAFCLRRGSGGRGMHPGGDGLVREIEALVPLTVSFLSQRRTRAPFGLAGGGAGQVGVNRVDGREVDGCSSHHVGEGAVIRVETPGGGGYGRAL